MYYSITYASSECSNFNQHNEDQFLEKSQSARYLENDDTMKTNFCISTYVSTNFHAHAETKLCNTLPSKLLPGRSIHEGPKADEVQVDTFYRVSHQVVQFPGALTLWNPSF